MNERAETAEYQIATISKEYRKLLQERDEELRRLKVDQERLKEQQKGFVGGRDGMSPRSPLKDLASSEFFSQDLVGTGVPGHKDLLLNGQRDGLDAVDLDDHGDFHDFGDIVSSQREINRLQSELAKLKIESQHWKSQAQQKVNSYVHCTRMCTCTCMCACVLEDCYVHVSSTVVEIEIFVW